MDLFKDIVPAILVNKKNIITSENEKLYNAFIVNRALSFHRDCIFQVNEMNKNSHIDNTMQNHYLLNTIRAYKRPYKEWFKKERIENLEVIKEYYNYSNEKAKEALKILSSDHINEIKKRINKGGYDAEYKQSHRNKT